MRKFLQDNLSFKPNPESLLRFPKFPNLESTLSEFLKTNYTHGTGQILAIRAPVYSMFCWDAVQLVILNRGGLPAEQGVTKSHAEVWEKGAMQCYSQSSRH